MSEVAALKVSDIDSKRMMLRVDQGKGRKDRHAMLSPVLLDLLRDWWRIARPTAWLFPGRDPLQPMSTRQLDRQADPPVPVLRRSHEHHRDLQARLNTSI